MTSEQEQALLYWLREMDSARVSTGLLALAFEAGWNAREEAWRAEARGRA
jgi:hypothetical protein